MVLTVGSLFSGIGGIDLGLERTGGFKTIWFCENDAYASAVLRKHWPDVPNLKDITKVDWDGIDRPDVLGGGFPCQDISIAGKGKGIKEGTRSGLWIEYAKAVRILQPRYVLIENVPMLADRGLNIVLGDLASMGYDAEWGIVSASAVGAPHTRKRLFILAYVGGVRCAPREHNREGDGILQDGERHMEDEEKDRDGQSSDTLRDAPPDAADNNGGRGIFTEKELRARGQGIDSNINSERIQRSFKEEIPRFEEFSWCENVRRVEEIFGRSDIPEPLVRGTGNGVPNRMDRIKCLGNAVVPQVAQVIGEMILEFDRLNKE